MLKAHTIDRTKAIGIVSLTTVATLLATRSVVHAEDNLSIQSGVQAGRGTSHENTSLFGEDGIFRTVTNILLFLVGAISVIMLVIGGIRYVVSGGDQQAVTNAKNTILYAIVGIVIAFLAYAAVNFVVGQLEGGEV